MLLLLIMMLVLVLGSIVVCRLHSPIWLLHVQNSHRLRANQGENSAARQRGQIHTHSPPFLRANESMSVRLSARPHFRSALQCCFKGKREKKAPKSYPRLHALQTPYIQLSSNDIIFFSFFSFSTQEHFHPRNVKWSHIWHPLQFFFSSKFISFCRPCAGQGTTCTGNRILLRMLAF